MNPINCESFLPQKFCRLQYVTGSAQSSPFAQKDYSYTQKLSVHSVSTLQCELVSFSGGHFANPMMSQLKEWCLWRAPIGWVCPETAPVHW